MFNNLIHKILYGVKKHYHILIIFLSFSNLFLILHEKEDYFYYFRFWLMVIGIINILELLYENRARMIMLKNKISKNYPQIWQFLLLYIVADFISNFFAGENDFSLFSPLFICLLRIPPDVVIFSSYIYFGFLLKKTLDNKYWPLITSMLILLFYFIKIYILDYLYFWGIFIGIEQIIRKGTFVSHPDSIWGITRSFIYVLFDC